MASADEGLATAFGGSDPDGLRSRGATQLVWVPQAREDYTHWQTADRRVLKRINRLLDDTLRDPFDGIGKREPLKYGIAGAWSRRITDSTGSSTKPTGTT